MSTPRRGAVRALSFLFLLLSLTVSQAARVPDLYQAEVPVARENTDSRNEAIRAALGEVLIKLTGRKPVTGADDLLAQAPGLVQQFRYQRVATADDGVALRLWVRFDKIGLDRAVRDTGLPLWSDSRPGVLIWLAQQDGSQRNLVGSDQETAQATRAAAAARGLALQWPLLDLEDQGRLTAADLWSDYAEGIAQASERYHQPLILAGRLQSTGQDHWEARWTLYGASNEEQFSSRGDSAAAAAAAGMDRLADWMAARYAPSGAAAQADGSLLVAVEDVRSAGDLARLLHLLGQQEQIDTTTPRLGEGDTLFLAISSRLDKEGLAQLLDVMGPLQRLPDLPPPLPVVPTAIAPPSSQVAPPSQTTPPGAPVVDRALSPAGGPVADVAPMEPAAPAPSAPPSPDLRYRLIR